MKTPWQPHKTLTEMALDVMKRLDPAGFAAGKPPAQMIDELRARHGGKDDATLNRLLTECIG